MEKQVQELLKKLIRFWVIKKILYLSYYFPPDLSAGAFRNKKIISNLISESNSNGSIVIDLFTTKPNRYDSYKLEVADFEKNNNLRINRINVPNHKSGFFGQSFSFLFYAFKVALFTRKRKYDLVFASSSRFMTAFLAAIISNQKGCKLFLDIRDIFLDTINDLFKGLKAKILIRIFNLVEKFTIKKADSINLVSLGFKEYFKEKYPNKKLFFYSNGVDRIFLETKFSQPNNKRKKILYAGNIGFGQGLHKILPSFAKSISKDWDIILIGDGSARKNLILELKNKSVKNVYIKKPVNRESLINYYDDADVLFLHLNDYSAFKKVLPSKIFEYAATEKPILAGVSGYAKKFIKSEISNAEVFSPCEPSLGIASLKKLKLKLENRSNFKIKYDRDTLSNSLAIKIINLIQWEVNLSS